jgi:hypothetical protein
MKLTVVLNEEGRLVGAHHGASTAPGQGSEAGLLAGPRQRLHVVDVPDEVAAIQDAAQFVARITPHLPKARPRLPKA